MSNPGGSGAALGLTADEIETFYERYAPTVYRRARAILRREADAWDAVQEVFLRLLREPEAFRREARPMTYVYAATTNVCLNLLRSRGVREADPGEAAPPSSVSSWGALEARNLLLRLSETLDERALHIAILQFIDGLPQEEIARLMDISRKTVGREVERIRTLAGGLGGTLAEDS